MPLRILMTADTVGGVWTYSLELARALEPHDIQIALATMGGPLNPEQRAEVATVPNVEVVESRYKLEWMEDPWTEVEQAGEWLLELESRVKPDLIHLNNYVHGSLPWSAPVLVVGHSCVLSWWQSVYGEAAPDSWDRYRREVSQGLQAADLVAAPTRAMLTELERYYGPLPPTRVIPNGRPARRFPPGKKEPFILTAGRIWDDAKNVAALDQVAPRLAWPVCVAGETQHPESGIPELNRVRLLGRLAPDVLAEWLGRAAIYALPARYEPFGLSALEAGLAGCALVLGDIPSLRDIWGEAAVFVPPDDTTALERTLKGLIDDEPRRETMARHARERALQLSPERMADGYRSAYEIVQRSAYKGSAQGRPASPAPQWPHPPTLFPQ